MHSMRCMHVDFFPSHFVSCENKGTMNLIPKLKVAGSIPVTRSNRSVNFKPNFRALEKPETFRKFSLHRCSGFSNHVPDGILSFEELVLSESANH